jgi:hypothetical protein
MERLQLANYRCAAFLMPLVKGSQYLLFDHLRRIAGPDRGEVALEGAVEVSQCRQE